MIQFNFKVEVHEAQNGQIAVSMFTTALQKDCFCLDKGYKLIFMDIQMPVMNGIESTKRMDQY